MAVLKVTETHCHTLTELDGSRNSRSVRMVQQEYLRPAKTQVKCSMFLYSAVLQHNMKEQCIQMLVQS